jgi:hypothetical protein
MFGNRIAKQYQHRDQGKQECHPATRHKVLKRIDHWLRTVKDDAERCLWITGVAGVGKTAIAITTVECLQDQRPVASQSDPDDDDGSSEDGNDYDGLSEDGTDDDGLSQGGTDDDSLSQGGTDDDGSFEEETGDDGLSEDGTNDDGSSVDGSEESRLSGALDQPYGNPAIICAQYFFNHQLDSSSVNCLFPTLAIQLANISPVAANIINAALASKPLSAINSAGSRQRQFSLRP